MCTTISKNPLHSNLVQFKQSQGKEREENKNALHSNLVQFKLSATDQCSRKCSLYIPIWYNSSLNRFRSRLSVILFTFQSGTIQANRSTVCVVLISSFTFQSGTIQATTGISPSLASLSLHSNLVQFKLVGQERTICALSFTFQSGTIQAISEQRLETILCNFTFQSGTIQANATSIIFSNEVIFTFQSGTIQAVRPRAVKVRL